MPDLKFNGTVLVAGATGRTGLWVVRRLLHYGIKTKTFSRSAAKLSEFKNLEVWLGKIQNSSAVTAAVQGCDAVISALGATELIGDASPAQVDGDGVIRLVDAAADAGVKKFILISSIAVTKPFHPLNLFGGVLSQKLRAENHIRKIFSENGRTYTIIRPGGLKDGDPFKFKLQFDKGDKITGLIDRSDVGEIAALSLWIPKATNQTFEVIRTVAEDQKTLEPYFNSL
jgi:nucleoside-diphosphate-sugar epimerase